MLYRVACEGGRWATVNFTRLTLTAIYACAMALCGERGRILIELPHDIDMVELNNLPGFIRRERMADSEVTQRYPSAIGVVGRAILFEEGAPWRASVPCPYRLPKKNEPAPNNDSPIFYFQ